MKNVFIVNSDDNTKVVTKGILSKDIEYCVPDGVKVKQKDIDSYADSLLQEFHGQALDSVQYAEIVQEAGDALEMYSTLTPYEIYQKIKSNN